MKASIQLSTNFIVVMVLTLTVIGFGFAIFGKIFAGVVELPDQIDDTQERMLEISLKNTDYAFSKNFVTVQRGESAIVWLGIVNSFDQKICYELDDERTIDGESDQGIQISESNLITRETRDNRYYLESIEIDAGRQGEVPILLMPPKNYQKGEYSITFGITPKDCSSDAQEADKTSRKLFVKVV